MARDVNVRMYNVGFGDAFLVELPAGDGAGDGSPFRVLVDCGAHSAGYPAEGWRPEDVVDQIVADISAGGAEPHIDVVVATHRHQDHVSGFRAAAWRGVTVDEVWLPWTENPADPRAVAILERQSRLALGLDRALHSEEITGHFASAELLASLQELAANSLTNEAAMATLHHGFRGRPRRRFLSSEDGSLSPAACPGLTVHVLGPSRDEEVIRDMDPPAGQSYLRFGEAAAASASASAAVAAAAAVDGGYEQAESTRSAPLAAHRPFPRSFSLTAEAFAEHWPELGLTDKIKNAATSIMREDDLAAAVALDKAVNGTSLMLMFELGDAFLLFPGDAQWGTWQAALTDPTSRDLLSRTTFYKIGHHGSHNATPRAFVEEVLAGRTIWGAAASVRPIARWPQIPKDELLDALGACATRVVRSDHPGGGGAGVTPRDAISVDFAVPC